jgi:proteic killer suppression protein
VIRSFKSKDTKRLFDDENCPRFRSINRQARRKLEVLEAATSLQELAKVPGNRLEALKGDRSGRFSIRINDQWRLCFKWADGDAFDVEIEDYH